MVKSEVERNCKYSIKVNTNNKCIICVFQDSPHFQFHVDRGDCEECKYFELDKETKSTEKK